MFLGIDCGTQGTKAVILDSATGQILGEGSAAHDMVSGPNGRREQLPEQWVQAFETATQQALAHAGLPGNALRGIGISGQQLSLIHI